LLLVVGLGMLWSAARKLESPETVQTGACDCAVGGRRGAGGQGAAVSLHAVGGQARQVEHAGGQRLARALGCGLVAGGGHRHRGNLAGYPILDPIAAAIVGFMVTRMGWSFSWDALHDLMDRAVDEQEVAGHPPTLTETPGVCNVHDVRTRKMGDMIVVDAHLEVDADISVEAGHDIAVEARQRVLQRHRVLNLMTHVDPWRRPDLDHAAPMSCRCPGREASCACCVTWFRSPCSCCWWLAAPFTWRWAIVTKR
jgi:cation diffusion facilitator family transporter